MATMLERLQAVDPTTVLFRSEDRTIEASTLRAAIARVARDLAGRPGTIALLCDSAALHFVGLMVGAVLGRRVILPAHDAPAYLDEIGVDAGVVVTDADRGRPHQYLLRLPDDGDGSPPLPEGTDPEVVFFTSGSTGEPKAVLKRLSRLEAEGAVLHRLWRLPPGKVESTVSHQHVYGILFRVVWPVLAGHVSRSEVSCYWEQLLDRLDPETILVTSPTHLTRMPEGLPWSRTRPALVFSSGAPLPLDAAVDAASKLGRAPIEVFGSTESGGIAWRRRVAGDDVWRPLTGVRLAASPRGGILIRSPFVDDDRLPLHLADAVELVDDGGFRLKGRLDRVVKIEGKRVSLPRVEQALLGLAEVADAAVIDLPDRKGALGAAVVPSAAGRIDLAREGEHRFSRRLRHALARRLEPMERPKLWRFPAAIPANSQGKRTPNLLRELFASERDVLPPSEILTLSETEAEIALDLRPDLVWFAGHFPDHPILPGVAQVHLSRLFARRLWRMEPGTSHMARVKFRRVIGPGDQVRLHLRRDVAKATLQFRYLNDGEPASEGVLGQT